MKIASVAFLVLAATIVGTPVRADQVVPPRVPAGLEPPAGHKPFLVGHAVGTQNYICAPSAAGPKWLFIGPQATVFGAEVEQILTHFQSKNPLQSDAIQATWQHSNDTSAVWARKFAGSSDPNYVAPDAIEWLLLEVTGGVTGPDNGDKLTHATFIQRVNTVGGREPATACTEPTYNTRKLVAYEADYVFYR